MTTGRAIINAARTSGTSQGQRITLSLTTLQVKWTTLLFITHKYGLLSNIWMHAHLEASVLVHSDVLHQVATVKLQEPLANSYTNQYECKSIVLPNHESLVACSFVSSDKGYVCPMPKSLMLELAVSTQMTSPGSYTATDSYLFYQSFQSLICSSFLSVHTTVSRISSSSPVHGSLYCNTWNKIGLLLSKVRLSRYSNFLFGYVDTSQKYIARSIFAHVINPSNTCSVQHLGYGSLLLTSSTILTLTYIEWRKSWDKHAAEVKGKKKPTHPTKMGARSFSNVRYELIVKLQIKNQSKNPMIYSTINIASHTVSGRHIFENRVLQF